MKANSKLFSKGREYEIRHGSWIKTLEYRHHIFDPGAEFQVIFAKEIRRVYKFYDSLIKRDLILKDKKNDHYPSYYSLVIKDGRIIRHRYSSPFDHQELIDKLDEKDSFELVNSMCFDYPFNIINQARLSKTSNPHIKKLLLLM